MWGNIVLEVSFLSNYHLGFNNTKTDILIHLTQWQYWWWFWFSYLWGLYFLLFLRIFRFRTLKFKPKLATTLRPRGKWGDLIVCIIPVSWCFNIITNSNLILRMIEWQAESSLFTIRIRGKQWYWVYKYDLKTVTDVLSTPKNVGNNKWQINTPGDLIVADNYLSVLQLRSYNKWCLKYWRVLIPKILKEEDYSPLNSNSELLTGLDLKPLNKKPLNKKFDNIQDEGFLKNFQTIDYFINRDYYCKNEGENKIILPPHWTEVFENLVSPSKLKNFKKIKKLFSINPETLKNSNLTEFWDEIGFENYNSWINLLKINPKLYNKKWSSLFKSTAVHDWQTWENYIMKSFKTIPINQNQFESYLSSFLLKNKNTFNSWSKLSTKNNLLLNKIIKSDFNLTKTDVNIFENQLTNLKEKSQFKINHDNLQEVNRWVRRSHGTISPCRLIKFPLSNQLESFNNNDVNDVELLRFRFNDKTSNIHHKPFSHNNFLIMRQKRYKRIKLMPLRIKKTRNPLSGQFDKTSKTMYSKNMLLVNNVFFEETNNKKVNLKYKLIKKYKKHAEQVPLTLWKRLLRTRRTLVLPAHVNITAITNSFDVVHSWFLPGLGLKLDCVPGRATHHVLHIDNVGFYYGQCAEICGRYHHHMPIRVCALPFEHFLVWWHSFGIPKLLFSNTDQKYLTKNYALRKYTW